MMKTVLIIVVLVLPISAISTIQEPFTVRVHAQDRLRIVVEEVQLPVAAYDGYGHLEPSLVIDDLLVLENGVPQEVRSVRHVPANVVLLLFPGNLNQKRPFNYLGGFGKIFTCEIKEMRFLLTLVLITSAVCATGSQSSKVHRQLMQKRDVTFKSPRDYAKRIKGNDPKTGEPIYYDPSPHVKLVDKKSGKYAFKWRGNDGKEKTVIFQRADAIDAVVSASVSRMTPGQYRYSYEIENLSSSGERLSGFTVQHFASDVVPERIDGIYTGTMSPSARHFYEGSWLDFGIPESFMPIVKPGKKIVLRLASSAPPGLVGCRISGGEQKTIGVGEDMPTELEEILPGYDDWPEGYTIGPTDFLRTLSPVEHAQYILDRLPQFEKLGWMTSAARIWYAQNLRSDNLDAVLKRAEQDLRSEQITTEVYTLLQSLKD